MKLNNLTSTILRLIDSIEKLKAILIKVKRDLCEAFIQLKYCCVTFLSRLSGKQTNTSSVRY